MRIAPALVALLLAGASCSTPPPPPDTSCECGARVCGSVCGKACGECVDDGVCASDGLACTPSRAFGAACTRDRECGNGRLCLSGARVPGGYCARRCSATNACPPGVPCLPGPDGENVCLAGCGATGSCRTAEGYTCEPDGSCPACVGSCAGRTCGDDGCGHGCGLCQEVGQVCDTGACAAPYAHLGGMVDAQGRTDARWDFSALANQNGQLFLVGGRKIVRDVDGNTHSGGVATVTRYDAVQRRFFAFAPLPEPVARPHAALLADVMYVAGGVTDSDDVAVADVASRGFYKQSGAGWLKLNQAAIPAPSVGGGLEAVGSKLYLLAGDSGAGPSSRMDLYDPVQDRWSEAPPRPLARTLIATAGDGDRLYVLGGWDGQHTSAAIEIFDPTSGWTRGPDLPIPVANAKAVVAAGRIFLFGGIDGPGEGDLKAVVQSFDLSTRRVQLLGTTYAGLVAQAPVRTRDGPVLLFGGTELSLGAFVPHDDVVSFRVPAP